MLVKRIADANNLVVVERAKMDTLIKEQDMNAGNRVKQGTGARVGRISGADALLSGDIIIFGRDDKKKSVKGGGILGGAIGAIAASKNEDKAVVAITYRLINAETSEVIATGEERGESVRKGSALGAMGGALGKGIAGVQIDMTSSNFAQTIIGEATQDCVNKLANVLKEQCASMKKAVREVETSVADVAGSTLMIAAGGNDLLVRYDTDAARSASTWKSAEAMRISLAGRGMTLNAPTAAAVGRLQLLYEQAAAAIKEHNWEEALSNLQAAEATTQKVALSVGR